MNRQQSGRLGGKKKAANHQAHVENRKKGASPYKPGSHRYFVRETIEMKGLEEDNDGD